MSTRRGHGIDRYPVKRARRPRRDTYEKSDDEHVLLALISLPQVQEIAAEFPEWKPGDVGAPPLFPPILHIAFGALAWHRKSKREAETTIRGAPWRAVRSALATMYPRYKGLAPGHKAIKRHHYERFRNKWGFDEEVLDDANRATVKVCVETAQDHRQLVASAGGSLTHPHPDRCISGDGVVLSPLTKRTADDKQWDLETGDLVGFRHDPDVRRFHTGDGKQPVGTKWVATQTTTRHEDETIILTISNQPFDTEGGEAAAALKDITRVKKLAPEMQLVAYDKALRGAHIDYLYSIGLQTAVKVSMQNGKPKTRRIGRHDARRGKEIVGQVEVTTVGGAPHIPVPIGGVMQMVRLEKIKTFHNGPHGKLRWYCNYQIPSTPEVPVELRRAVVRIRINRLTEERDGTLNRAEVLRPIVEADDEWPALYHGRPGSEGTNSWLKDRMAKRRAPSLGIKRQRMDLLCCQVYKLVRAIIAHRHRMGLPDPAATLLAA